MPKLPKLKSLALDLNIVPFSDHALERFAERYLGDAKNLNVLAWAEPLARDALLQSQERGLTQESANLRAIANLGQRARYFVWGKWRFVIKPESSGWVVITFEEIIYR